MKFMKSLRTVLLGVAIAAVTLSSVAPAFALGGCGRNYHRNAHGRCVYGGQSLNCESSGPGLSMVPAPRLRAPRRLMSALGHKVTQRHHEAMSALPSKRTNSRHVGRSASLQKRTDAPQQTEA